MRIASLPRLALVAALVLAAGCSSNKDKIEGTMWNSAASTVKGKQLPAGARQLHFDRDGRLIYADAGRIFKGTYDLGMGSAVTFNLEQEFEGRKIHPYKIVVDGDQLTLTSADGSKVKYVKIH